MCVCVCVCVYVCVCVCVCVCVARSFSPTPPSHRPMLNFSLVSTQTLELRDFFPCTCQSARIPQRVDWQLTNRPGHTPGDSCGCYVDVGYVSRDGSYITMPRKVTIDVNVRKCSVGCARC